MVGGGLNGNRSCMKSITLYVVRIVLPTKQRKRFLSSEAVVNYMDSIILRGILFEQKFSINAGHPWTKAYILSCTCITEAEL